ncbi:MAG TPA: hypothetical protein VGF17_19865, partial [Phytomonospora sp.]
MFMMQFLREFGSWHWDGEFDDPEATAAFAATGTAQTPREFRRLHLILLRSTDPAARAAAIDFYDRANTTSRFGESNPFEPHFEEMIAVARELLRTPPVAGRKLAAASHASALLALKFDAMPDDAPFIATMLESAPEGELLYDALNVAGEIFNQSDVPDPRLVAAVAAIATDPEADYEDRREALGALVEVVEPAVTALFAAIATGGDQTRLRQHAAWQLASGRHFYGHRALLARLDADWPDGEPGWPASEITEALAPGPHSIHWAEQEPDLPAELAAALDELRSPTTEDGHLAAFRRLLHSGHPVASAIALDHFHMDDGLDRFGLDTSPHAAE